MAEYYFSVNTDNDRMLCIAPLTDEKIAAAGGEIGDTSGYFLYETRQSAADDVVILARLVSEEAAFDLSRRLHME